MDNFHIYTSMTVNGTQTGVPCSSQSNCGANTSGCIDGTVANFCIKRHDTKPDFRVSVSDCDGPLDLTDELLILEVNMWAKAKIKTAISASDTYFQFADAIGFEQMMVGDILVMERVRLPEQMLVLGFDEANELVLVERGYNGTTASAWKKGSSLKIMRVINGVGEISSITDDILQEDGTTAEDQLIETQLVYEWDSEDTCLPGCYYLEFKLLKMLLLGASALAIDPDTISFTPISFTPADFGCDMGSGVEWVRRFPEAEEGFLIHILDSPTSDTF